jgi:hypothetical protein
MGRRPSRQAAAPSNGKEGDPSHSGHPPTVTRKAAADLGAIESNLPGAGKLSPTLASVFRNCSAPARRAKRASCNS